MAGRNKALGPRGVQRRSPAPVTRVADVAPTSGGSGVTLPIDLATQVSGDLPFSSLAQGSALSVLGVTGNAVADHASIVAASDHQVLRRSGVTVGFGALDLAQAAARTGLLPFGNLEDVTGPVVLARTTGSAGPVSAHTLSQVLDFIGSAAQGDILFRGAAGWQRLAAGTSGRFLQTLGGAADPAWATAAIGGGSLYSGTGHPQGVQAAGLGGLYVDANNGYIYRKLGGGSTTYGWYYWPLLGAGLANAMPHFWQTFLPTSGTTAIWNGNSHGAFGADTVAGLVGSSLNNQARTIISGKTWAQAETGAVSGNTSGTNTQTTNMTRVLDDDIDITAMVRFPTITDIRIWFGLSISAFSADTATHGSTGAGSICFRYSTPEGDPGWVGCTQINGAGNQTVSANVANIAANTNYYLRIRFIRSGTPTVYFSVNDGTEVSQTTNIPPTGNNYMLGLQVTTKTNALRQFLSRGFGAVIGS